MIPYRPLVGAMLAVIVLLAVPATLAARDHCEPPVAKKLQSLGLGPSHVREAMYLCEKTGDGEGVAVGIKVWLRMKSCTKGYQVVDLHLDCAEIQTFTDGPCRIKGVAEG